jgi:hypothetical protein
MMLRLSEFGIPAKGWPGRRRAIARLVLQVVGLTAFLIFALGGLLGLLVMAAAATDGLPR